MKILPVRKLRSKNYKTVIEVRVPTRFYWTEDGFDGIEFGPLKGCTKYCLRLLTQILDGVPRDWLPDKEELTPIPDTFRNAFKNGELR